MKKAFLLACSGGPDSMALLAIYKDVYDLHVGHVNYHHRPTAQRDEQLVAAYCREHHIPFHKRDYVDLGQGNFQDAARIFRYAFFAELCHKYHLQGVLVGHHFDDLLETYLLQKKRGSLVSYYGLRSYSFLLGVRVYRPLLNKEKAQLQQYCDDQHIPYGIDESNLSDDYQRNIIRHQLIEKLSLTEKRQLALEIKDKNRQLRNIRRQVREFIGKRVVFGVEEFLQFPYKNQLLAILFAGNFSAGQVADIFAKLSALQARIELGDYWLVREYGMIKYFKKPRPYCFTYHKLQVSKHKYFKSAFVGSSLEACFVRDDDFPLQVRNFQEGDEIALRFGKKRLSRFFIDRKIAFEERLSWPVVVNSSGEIVLVPGIGCSVGHYSAQANWFVIKL